MGMGRGFGRVRGFRLGCEGGWAGVYLGVETFEVEVGELFGRGDGVFVLGGWRGNRSGKGAGLDEEKPRARCPEVLCTRASHQ